jgi:hypothetical protein
LLTNNAESLTFSQLGGDGGLHFLGPIRGVLPIGPNGVPAFNTLKPSPLSDPKIMAGMVSYDYILKHQGITSNISCSYSSEKAVNFTNLDAHSNSTTLLAVSYNARCPEQHEIEVIPSAVGSFRSVWSNNTLAYWACQSATDADSYSIYLAGNGNRVLNGFYFTTIGNITCSVNRVQTAIYPLSYNSTTKIFTAGQPVPESLTDITFPNLLPYALQALGSAVSEGQNFEANAVAESVLTFAYKSFDVPPPPKDSNLSPKFLPLFEKMIQGILEYEVCSIGMSSCHPSYLHLLGHLLAIDILVGRQSTPCLLQSHGDRFCELPSCRLVCVACQRWLFDPNNDHQWGCFRRSRYSYVDSVDWRPHISSVSSQTSHHCGTC